MPYPRVEYPVIDLYTLASVAEQEEITRQYLHQMLSKDKSDAPTWRGWKFIKTSSTARGEWLAYRGDFVVRIN